MRSHSPLSLQGFVLEQTVGREARNVLGAARSDQTVSHHHDNRILTVQRRGGRGWSWSFSDALLSSLVHRDLSSNQLSSLPLEGLQSLTHLRLAGNTELMELMAREDLPRVR